RQFVTIQYRLNPAFQFVERVLKIDIHRNQRRPPWSVMQQLLAAAHCSQFDKLQRGFSETSWRYKGRAEFADIAAPIEPLPTRYSLVRANDERRKQYSALGLGATLGPRVATASRAILVALAGTVGGLFLVDWMPLGARLPVVTFIELLFTE